MNKRGSLRDIGFSLLVVVILLMSIFTLQGVNEKPEPTYGDIRQLLLQQKVSRVEVDGNKLTLELKPGTEYGSGPIVHNLPSFDSFHEEFNDILASQQDAGLLTYDYTGAFQKPWWFDMLSWVAVFAVFGVLWYVMFLRQNNAGGGGGGDRTARFGRAGPGPTTIPSGKSPSPMWLAPRRRRPSFRRSWSSCGTPSVFWSWAPASPRVCCW